jgi:hypothetical protein
LNNLKALCHKAVAHSRPLRVFKVFKADGNCRIYGGAVAGAKIKILNITTMGPVRNP